MSIIKVKDLRKTYKVNIKREGFKESIKNLIRPQYKEVEAIKNISFQIDDAELIGIVGLNGAGKTTLLKILSGLIYPTGGEVNVLDYNPWDKKKEFLKQIGMAAGQKSQLWWDLPAIESYKVEKAIYQIEEVSYNEMLKELSEMLDVEKLFTIC